MITKNQTKNANFLRIVFMLQYLRKIKKITGKEYLSGMEYYRKLTGADIEIVT